MSIAINENTTAFIRDQSDFRLRYLKYYILAAVAWWWTIQMMQFVGRTTSSLQKLHY